LGTLCKEETHHTIDWHNVDPLIQTQTPKNSGAVSQSRILY